MTPSFRAQAVRRAARRYRACGHHAFWFAASKLRIDPVYRDLLSLDQNLGHVVDIGCGRGQLAALLLETGLATRVTGLDWNRIHLDQARTALSGLAFEGHAQDFAVDQTVPEADTVAIVDVLYQLTSEVQDRLLESSCRAARGRLLVRTLDSGRGARGAFAMAAERLLRPFLSSSGAFVNPLGIPDIGARIAGTGFDVETMPSFRGTPFSNIVLLGTRATVRS